MARLSLFAGFAALALLASGQAAELPDTIKQAGALHLTMIADGTSKKVLDKYGLGANAVREPLLNAAPQ